MSDKMRDEFEAWRLATFCGGIDRLKTCRNASDTYYYADVHQSWKAWQASRAADKERINRLEELLWDIGHGCSLRDMPSEATIAEWQDSIDAALAKQEQQ
jgi:hypothetical protein